MKIVPVNFNKEHKAMLGMNNLLSSHWTLTDIYQNHEVHCFMKMLL
jgi:hypothetical protein